MTDVATSAVISSPFDQGFDEPEHIRVLRTRARAFVADILEPAEIILDNIPNPRDTFDNDVFRDAMRAAADNGYTRATLPVDLGGSAMSARAQYALVEELAAGAPGLGSHIFVAGVAASLMAQTGVWRDNLDYLQHIEQMADPAFAHRGGCWAATEPTVGSDILTFDNPAIRYQTTATRTPGGFVISGTKSMFVSNGYCADWMLVQATYADATDMSDSGVFLIPTSAPGVTRHDPADKVGLRALNQASVTLDAVHVDAQAQVVGPGPGFERFVTSLTSRGNVAVGLQSIGVARRAYEYALDYAKQRRQGGECLIAHQLIADKLVRAYGEISAARAGLYRAVSLIEAKKLDPLICYSARVHASRVAIGVVEQMTQILGGYGITKTTPMERYYRDIKLLTVADGTVEKVSLLAARYL